MAAKTPTEILALDDYTNAQMLKLVRWNIATLVSSPDATVTLPGGRSYTVHQLDALQRLEKFYAEKAGDDADATAVETVGCPVVRYQEEQT